MTRRIRTDQIQAEGGPAPKLDGYFDRLQKYIPADVVAAWIAVSALIAGDPEAPQATILWIAFAIGLVLTALWTHRQTAAPESGPARTQIAISTFAFLVWVFALGEPFASLDFYRPLYGSLVLILFTLVVGLVVPNE